MSVKAGQAQALWSKSSGHQAEARRQRRVEGRFLLAFAYAEPQDGPAVGLVADRGRRCRAGAGDRVGAARAGSGLARPTWFINLTCADLTNMDLHGALLWDARLAGTIFDGAHLTSAHLTGAHLVLPPKVAAEAFRALPFVSRVVERR